MSGPAKSDMENLIQQYCQTLPRKRFKTFDLLNHIKQELGDSFAYRGGYPQFVIHMETFVDRGLLIPVKAWKHNGMQPPLYNGYLYREAKNPVDPKTKQKLLTAFHPRLNLAPYLADASLYEKDSWFLAKIDKFFKSRSDYASGALTINERSFEIFHNEKWLASNPGQALIQRLGLSIADLECHWTYEPFFYYQLPQTTKVSTVLIVENKDTFFTFKDLLQQKIDTWQEIAPTVLVYGEGNKILHSFAFIHEIFPGPLSAIDFWYFGDLDPVGINIWHNLSRLEPIEIKPATLFYTGLFDLWGNKAPKLKTAQPWNSPAIEAFLSYFTPLYQGQFLTLLENKNYLPQEGLHSQALRKLSTRRKGFGDALD